MSEPFRTSTIRTLREPISPRIGFHPFADPAAGIPIAEICLPVGSPCARTEKKRSP